MSFDISLCDPISGETLHSKVPHQIFGGTHAVNGTTEMWVNVTYNYSRWYYEPGVFSVIDDPLYKEENRRGGIRALDGMSGAKSIPVLENAIRILEGMDKDISEEEIAEKRAYGCDGYWLPTRGNAIRPLYQLLAMAQMRPDGVWEVV